MPSDSRRTAVRPARRTAIAGSTNRAGAHLLLQRAARDEGGYRAGTLASAVGRFLPLPVGLLQRILRVLLLRAVEEARPRDAVRPHQGQPLCCSAIPGRKRG